MTARAFIDAHLGPLVGKHYYCRECIGKRAKTAVPIEKAGLLDIMVREKLDRLECAGGCGKVLAEREPPRV